MNEQFILRNLQFVMVEDSLESSQPLHTDVNGIAKISSLFSQIPYKKGLIYYCSQCVHVQNFFVNQTMHCFLQDHALFVCVLLSLDMIHL